jgi:RNA polymerase sigma-70 factor, ECF subfamily
MPSPVVRLNRAVAVAMAGDPDGGLEIVDELTVVGELDGYHLLEATRADLLRRRGDLPAAADAYKRALALAPTEPERRFLTRRLTEARGG